MSMTTFVRGLRESVATLVVGCTLVVCAEAPAAGQEAELLELQKQWASARIAGDVAFLERFYAKEFWITSMSGSVVTREQDIGVFASREMKPETIVDEDMTVTVYDDFAIVAGRENLKVPTREQREISRSASRTCMCVGTAAGNCSLTTPPRFETSSPAETASLQGAIHPVSASSKCKRPLLADLARRG
jgi:hypothetical protein